MSTRCYECEIVMLTNVSNDESICDDCAKSRPFADKTIDHIYVKKLQKNSGVTIAIARNNVKHTVRYLHNKRSAKKRPSNKEEKLVEKDTNKKSNFAYSIRNNSSSECANEDQQSHTTTALRTKENFAMTALAQQMTLPIREANQPNILSEVNKNGKSNGLDTTDFTSSGKSDDDEQQLQKRSSEVAPISMTNVNLSKSIPQYVSGTEGEVGRILGSNDNRKLNTNNSDNATKMKIIDMEDRADCCHRSTNEYYSFLCHIKHACKPLPPSPTEFDGSNGSKDLFDESEQNHTFIPSIQELGQLEQIRVREAELKKKIGLISAVFAKNESVAIAFFKKIADLKSKHVENQKFSCNKETSIRALGIKRIQLLTLAEACRKDRDRLRIYVKDAKTVVRHAREALNTLEEQVSGAKQELAAVRDSGLIDLRLEALKNKEKRIVAAVALVSQSIKFQEEAQEDFLRAEEDIRTVEVAYERTLEQSGKEKFELEILHQKQNTTERDLEFCYSELKRLREKHREDIRELQEFQRQLLDIQYQRKRKVQDIEKVFVNELLSIVS